MLGPIEVLILGDFEIALFWIFWMHLVRHSDLFRYAVFTQVLGYWTFLVCRLCVRFWAQGLISVDWDFSVCRNLLIQSTSGNPCADLGLKDGLRSWFGRPNKFGLPNQTPKPEWIVFLLRRVWFLYCQVMQGFCDVFSNVEMIWKWFSGKVRNVLEMVFRGFKLCAGMG